MNLKEQIIKANLAYRSGEPIISDEEYDSLLEKLEDEMGFIEFECFKQSLTEEKGTVTNRYVLGSLSKFKYEEPEKFHKWLKDQKLTSIFCTDKIDGCSFYAEYREGKLTLLTSRGDGDEGTDWTHKAGYINIPKVIKFTGDLDIRGEVTLTEDTYEKLGFKTKRTGTAGIMNAKEVEPEKLKHIHAIAYEILSGSFNINDQFELLLKLGFDTPTVAEFHVTSDVHENIKDYYFSRKNNSMYDMDGIVISSRNYVPENVFYPKSKIAFKINSTGVPTTVKDIEWNISKGGLLKPVVLVEATNIDGVVVQRVTGFNAKYILDNRIFKGAEILIVRSGEVIPKIVGITKPSGNAFSVKVCPSCGSNLEWEGVDLKCFNDDCGATQIKSLASFLIKCGVEGVTETSLENWGINNFDDLFTWTPDNGSKNHVKFVTELKTKVFSKTKEDLFACMTFNGAGETNIKKLIDFYGKGDLIATINKLYVEKNISDFPEGIGQKVIDKIEKDVKNNIKIVRKIVADARYNPVAKVASAPSSTKFAGKSFCITGTLSKGRKEFEKMVTDNGGVLASVSKKLDFLLVGDDAGSKLDKAKSLGVKVINEDEFTKMIESN